MERIREMVAQSPDGTITAEQVAKAGLYHGMLQKLVDAGELNKFGHGLYARNDVWEDGFFLLQRKYSRFISTRIYGPNSDAPDNDLPKGV